jgi:hypothetical protein
MKSTQQIEVNWGEPEAFALIIQQTTDGEREAKEKARAAKDRQESENRQEPLI